MTNSLSDQLHSIPQTAKITNQCVRGVYNRLNDGSIRAVKMGRKTLVRQSEIDRYLADLPSYEPRVA